MQPTAFTVVYDDFLSKITDDMYLELTEQDTLAILKQLLLSAIPKFEFPRQTLEYAYITQRKKNQEGEIISETKYWAFLSPLTLEEVNILSTYMIVEWLGQQLASIENVRMKYSGADFKFTSQANHMQKILQMKKDYEREGFHLQRLYKRRIADLNGVYHSTMHKIMEPDNEGFPSERRPDLPDPHHGGGDIDVIYTDDLVWEDIVYEIEV